MTRRRLLAVALALAMAAGACSDDDESGGGGDQLGGSTVPATATTLPADSFDAAVCPATLRWSSSIVVIANDFADLSRPLDDDPGERRRVYLETFDRVAAATDELADVVGSAPAPRGASADAIVEGVVDAVEAASEEVAAARAIAGGLGTADFRFRSVRGGKLYVTTEKARAIVLHALGDLAEDHDYPALAGGCGRR